MYLYTDFKCKDVNRLSGVNVRILLVWGWMHWAFFRKNTLLFLMGLGCMRQVQLSFPVLCVCTLTALMSMSQFSELPTQASQPAGTIPAILQGVAECYKPCDIRAGQGYQATLLWSPRIEQSFNWVFILIVLSKQEEKSPALSCSSGLSLGFLSIISGVSVGTVSLTFPPTACLPFQSLFPISTQQSSTKYWDTIFQITAWTLW